MPDEQMPKIVQIVGHANQKGSVVFGLGKDGHVYTYHEGRGWAEFQHVRYVPGAPTLALQHRRPEQ